MKYHYRTTHTINKTARRKQFLNIIIILLVLTAAYYILLNWFVLAVIYLSQFVSLLWEIIL